MADITKAIKKEQEYLSYRAENKEPFHLVDAIKKYGFNSLDEYFQAKKECEIKQLGFTYDECNPKNCLSKVFATIANGETKFLFMISDTTFVFNCSDDFDEEFCKSNNITVYQTEAKGGTIVSTPGDVSFCICVPKETDIDVGYILKHIAAILSKYMDGIAVDGNDILRDGKKVLGSANYYQNDMFALVSHVSFNDNSELISKICREPKSGKFPGRLLNITPEQFKQEVFEWLQVK